MCRRENGDGKKEGESSLNNKKIQEIPGKSLDFLESNFLNYKIIPGILKI